MNSFKTVIYFFILFMGFGSSLRADDLRVPEQYPTLSSALEVAHSGDRIILESGDQSMGESISLYFKRGVTIIGMGEGKTTLRMNGKYAFFNGCEDLTISDMSIDCARRASTGDFPSVMRSFWIYGQCPGLLVSQCHFIGSSNALNIGGYGVPAVTTLDLPARDSATVVGCTFECKEFPSVNSVGVQFSPIGGTYTRLNLKIEKSTFTCLKIGVRIGPENYFTDFGPISLKGNFFDACSQGISFIGSGTLNTGTLNISNNQFRHGVEYQVALELNSQGDYQIAISRNKFADNKGYALKLMQVSGPRVYCQYNDFVGNENGVLIGVMSPYLDLRRNYWGNSSGPRHPANPRGTGDLLQDNSGTVLFSPWLKLPATYLFASMIAAVE